MVLDTFDVPRATNDVLVSEASKIDTAPPQPAIALKLGVVIGFPGASVLSPILAKILIGCKRLAAKFAEILFGHYPTNVGINRVASSSNASATHIDKSLH